MKRTSSTRLTMTRLALVLSMSIVPSVHAALTDVAGAPMANTASAVVKPNLLFLLDASGSMDWDFMPDSVANDPACKTTGSSLTSCNFGDPPYNSALFNGLAYNPAITYIPAVRFDGTSYPSYTTWTAVPNDAFGVQFSGTIDLTTAYPDKIYCNTSSPTTTDRTPPFASGVCKRPIQAGVWTYPNSTYNRQSTPASLNPYYYTISSLLWCNGANSGGFGTGTCQPKKTATFQYPKYGTGSDGFTRVDIVPATANYPRVASRTDCTGAVGATGCSYAQEMTNFANWYAYYRTRMQMMKTAAGLAFKQVTDSFRVGFMTINPGSPVSSTYFLPIADFTAGSGNQKDQFYAKFYAQNPNLSTPLREALSRAGRYYAHVTTGINSGITDDPVQYSCQQNFTIMSTDGFWNGSSGQDLSGNPVGNQDNNPTTAPRPLLDASAQISTVTSNNSLSQRICSGNSTVFGATPCGCAANYSRVKQQTSSSTSTVVTRDGVVLSTTPGTATTYQDITACNATVTTTVTPVTVVEQQAVNGTNATTFGAINGVAAGANTTGTCASVGYAQIIQRTTTYNQTVVSTDGVPGAPTYSGTAYAFAPVGSCVSVTTKQMYSVTEQAQWVSTSEGFGLPSSFSAAGNATNPQTTFSCSGSGTRTLLLQRVLGYTKTVTTIGAGPPTTTYSANTSGPTFSTVASCSTTGKSAAATAVTTTLTSTTTTGGPTPAATTTTNGTPSSTSTGATISSADFTIAPVSGSGSSATAGPASTVTTSSTTGPMGYSDTLADVAQYYYITDLRAPGSLGAAVGSPATQLDVGSANNVPGKPGTDPQNDSANWQHMTTFTLGLGVDGTLNYTSDYRTNPTGDFLAIINGTKNWPQPIANDVSAVDDLWHAAVNGRGTYFSARDPAQLATGLSNALIGVQATSGSAAAAATSNLEPVAGDNFAYVASYETVRWNGDVEARTIDLNTGAVSPTAIWSAQAQLDTLSNATTPGGANRVIKRFNAGATSKLQDFTWANLSAAEQNYFSAGWVGTGVAALSQWGSLTATQQTAAAGVNLVNFLRGDSTYESQASVATSNQLYRDRQHVLGDIVDGAPVYVKQISANYTDAAYASPAGSNFKECVNTGGAGCSGIFSGPRNSIVYVAANDGMLHAFDGLTGAENWAFIPNILLPNLYRLADKNYANIHQWYVDGSPTVGDVYDPVAGKWKTILVGGLDGGGRGYYALDVTDPANPIGLWEFNVRATASCPSASPFTSSTILGVDKDDCDLGYTYGNPIITKLGNGTWVVVVTSGYNNVNPGDGKGYVYVLNPITGVIQKKIQASNAAQFLSPGNTTTPLGLARINNWVDDTNVDNTTLRVYGGDLQGYLWRFNLDTGTAYAVVRYTDPSGAAQPVTVKPELGDVNGTAMIYVGTGRYLGTSDLPSTQVQTIYGIKDATNGVTPAAPINVRGATVVAQTLTNGTTGTGAGIRTATSNAVDLSTKNGWRADLPTSGERVNVDPKLQLGTLIVGSNVPASTACTSGGTSYLNYLDYKTGGYIQSSGNTMAGVLVGNSLVVGISVVRLPNNKTVAIVTTSDNKYPNLAPPFSTPSPTGRRSSWRELPQ